MYVIKFQCTCKNLWVLLLYKYLNNAQIMDQNKIC